MSDLNKNTKKVCSFYVSEWHLITMIIPYLREKTNSKANIITIFEKSMKENIETLMEKVVLNNEDKEKILSINWNKSEEKIENKINIKNENETIVIIAGSKDYIKSKNRIIDEYKNKNITVINCFELANFKDDIKDILETHKYVLNTSGEKKVEDVFEMYVS